MPGDDDGHEAEGSHGDSVSVGRVEVVIGEGGEWGTVCGEDFSDLSAHVICRQLGFDTFEVVYIGRYVHVRMSTIVYIHVHIVHVHTCTLVSIKRCILEGMYMYIVYTYIIYTNLYI